MVQMFLMCLYTSVLGLVQAELISFKVSILGCVLDLC